MERMRMNMDFEVKGLVNIMVNVMWCVASECSEQQE